MANNSTIPEFVLNPLTNSCSSSNTDNSTPNPQNMSSSSSISTDLHPLPTIHHESSPSSYIISTPLPLLNITNFVNTELDGTNYLLLCWRSDQFESIMILVGHACVDGSAIKPPQYLSYQITTNPDFMLSLLRKGSSTTITEYMNEVLMMNIADSLASINYCPLEEEDADLNGLALDSNYDILVVTHLQHQIHSSLTFLSGLPSSTDLLVHEKWLLLRATNMRSTHQLDSVNPSAFAAQQQNSSYSNNQKSKKKLDYKAAKLLDFGGLAKDGLEGDETHVSTRVMMGTQGYAATPEYVMTVNHGKPVHPRRKSRDLTFIHRMRIMMVLVLAGILFSGMSAHCALPAATLHLEGSFTVGAELSVLQAKDQARHSFMGVVDFPVLGASPVDKVGLYFTKVKIGNPPKEFHVMIDTGSDITWLNCISCIGCPRTSSLVQLSLFDPSSSSSAASVSCSDSMCKSEAHSGCSSNSMCTYSLSNEDGNGGTSGYYVSDVFTFDTMMAGSTMGISSANITFGCSMYQSGDLTLSESALDGVLGFGHQQMSVISQLASHGHTSAVFSYCLKGDGGGVLVLGEIREPGIIYSPLDLSGPYYKLYLLSISISGQTVPIAPDVFTRNGGTIVDAGTNLAYLAAEAYDLFFTALVAAVPPSVSTFPKAGSQCFLVSSSVGSSIRDVFPLVSLNFAGGASMVLKPNDYLWQRVDDVSGVWCIAFQKGQGMTVLGDLVLKDKIIVYDLAGQRLGWADYDCSSPVNASLDSPAKHVSRSSRNAPLFPIASVALIVCISMSAGFFFLV